MKLPKEVFSHLGPIPVAVVPRVKDKGNPWGMFWYGERRIDLLSKQTDASLLATLGRTLRCTTPALRRDWRRTRWKQSATHSERTSRQL
jgi:hypothetical protein